MLLQVLTSQGGALAVAGSAVVCVQPASGDPELAVVPSGEAFCPAEGEELNLIVQHSVPCEITLTVEDEEGQMVCRLLSAEPTRPEHLWPEGTTVAWTGQNAEGGQAPAGRYRLRARVRLGGVTYEAFRTGFSCGIRGRRQEIRRQTENKGQQFFAEDPR